MNTKHCKGCGTEIEEFETYCSPCRWFFRIFTRRDNTPQKYDELNQDKDRNEWRRVLEEIYRDNWHVYAYKNLDENHPLAKKLKISGRSLQKSLSFLDENGLVSTTHDIISLTPKGFDVARENQHIKLNAVLQTAIIYFTTIIAATAMFQFFKSLEIWSAEILLRNYMIGIGLIAIGSYQFIFKRLIK